MALNPSFTASQNSGLPSTIVLTDTSTGSDINVTHRRVYLLQSNGTYLVPSGVTTDYIEWPLTGSTISLDVLSQDTALTITVQWLSVTNVVLNTVTNAYAFVAYNETFYYGLTEDQVGNPNLVSSTNFYENKMILRVEIDSAIQAVSFASDIVTAQSALNRATYISTNSNFFF